MTRADWVGIFVAIYGRRGYFSEPFDVEFQSKTVETHRASERPAVVRGVGGGDWAGIRVLCHGVAIHGAERHIGFLGGSLILPNQ